MNGVKNGKRQVVHFRKKRKVRTTFSFSIGSMDIKTVERYEYLGVTLNENLDFRESAQELAEAGGRALGVLISKFTQKKYTKIYWLSYIYETV